MDWTRGVAFFSVGSNAGRARCLGRPRGDEPERFSTRGWSPAATRRAPGWRTATRPARRSVSRATRAPTPRPDGNARRPAQRRLRLRVRRMGRHRPFVAGVWRELRLLQLPERVVAVEPARLGRHRSRLRGASAVSRRCSGPPPAPRSSCRRRGRRGCRRSEPSRRYPAMDSAPSGSNTTRPEQIDCCAGRRLACARSISGLTTRWSPCSGCAVRTRQPPRSAITTSGPMGDANIDGVGVSMSHAISSNVRGSIEYAFASAQWVDGPSSADSVRLARATPALLSGTERQQIHDVTTSIEAEVPQSATRVFLFYRITMRSSPPRPTRVDSTGASSCRSTSRCRS